LIEETRFPGMRNRTSPWKWPACIGLAFSLLLGVVFVVPRHWIDAFFSPLSLTDRWQQKQGPQWLVLVPPPELEIVTDPQPDRPVHRRESLFPRDHLDPEWWTRGWRIEPVTGPQEIAGRTARDSVAILLTALGVERDFMKRTRPDSVLAVRLFMMKVEDSFRFEELKPYLSAMARCRDYADLMSRKADMYDDFLRQQIMTPD
jgi:hypothetical protein